MRGNHETRVFRRAIFGKLNSAKNKAKPHWREHSRAYVLFGALCEWFELAGAVLTLTLAEIKHERRQSVRSLHDLEEARKAVLSEAADVANYALFAADNCGALEDA